MFDINTNKEDLILKSYYYDLPKELIAQEPLVNRDDSRLLVIFKDGILHTQFKQITSFFKDGDVLVMNNTRVLKTKLIGRKQTGGKASITLIDKLDLKKWRCYIHAKNPKIGTQLIFDNLTGIITGQHKNLFDIEFSKEIDEYLDKKGHYTLPPYIKQKLDNEERYQTVYSEEKGSVAAPTAGLHFSTQLLNQLQKKIKIAFVTLNVSLGTFEPVRTNYILKHDMHSEFFKITNNNAEIIKKAKRLFVVGTTSLRVLESLNQITETNATTKLFIYPGYHFKHNYSGLITNFHLPESTLLMLVSAIVGRERILKIYKRAIELKYRFFSLGDATFIIDDCFRNYKVEGIFEKI